MIKFNYFGDTSKAYTNVITIVSEIEYTTDYNVLRFGVAYSNKTDVYDKKIGRRIALGRFNKSPYRVVLPKEYSFNFIINTMLDFIIEEVADRPNWVEDI